MPFLVVANPVAGRGGEAIERARREIEDARLLLLGPGVDLRSEIHEALAKERVVVACGGDGTVNAVAQHLAGADGVMAVVPGGTLNHFARDLGMRRLDISFETLRSGRERRVDV